MGSQSNRLKELRQKQGVSLGKLSTELKENYQFSLSPSQLMYYENGKRQPRNSETWKILANYFGVSVGYLLGFTENPKQYDDEQINDQYANWGVILTSSKSRDKEDEEQLYFKRFVQYIKTNHMLLSDTEIKSIYKLLISMDLSNSNNLKGKLFKDALNKDFHQYEDDYIQNYSILLDDRYEKPENEMMLDVYLKELKIDIGIDGIISILKPFAEKNHESMGDNN
ncbi:phage-associated protein [Streptococcus cristatus]|uniref:HTH cro/C1-type domain-containing protein n=2 Tax=Streptococcus cristatus TaxID=45634 RepID=A0A512AAV3_STRCR|nr:helix-turn-helix transcriptional regulator [Streptococcus cristatus]AGK70682.1 phage-associated protein [Streptococcus cristatus AS 1.3089]QBX09444.1 hypothetical protein JavanS342_0002 [Streptococcus satellite phage Javan342]GEN96819.1 hypothetical protein SOL01_06930 [Streptococcus cristatus]SQI46591.1 phage-associated protein [Streptococcus cristatus]